MNYCKNCKYYRYESEYSFRDPHSCTHPFSKYTKNTIIEEIVYLHSCAQR